MISKTSADTLDQCNNSISVSSIRSIVTINPAVAPSGNHCSSSRHLLSNNLSRLATTTTSIATATYYQDETIKRGDKEGGASSRISLVATCTKTQSRYDDKTDENNQSNQYSKITLATIISSPMNDNNDNMEYRVLGMQYSATSTSKSSSSSPAYTTVCIATTIHHQSILLAIDSSGILHTCRIKHQEPQTKLANGLLDIQECQFNTTTRGSTPKKGKKSKPNKSTTYNDEELQRLLSQMNALSARMESIEQYTNNEDINIPSPASTTLQSPAKTTSSSKKKGRKRKHSPSKISSSHDNIDDTSNTHTIHLVASNLNGQVIPSSSPPVVMVLSSSRTSEQWSLMAWSKITGLEDVHVFMTCIIFVSKAKCGPKIWKSIISMMELKEQEDEQEYDEGIVLVGFQDGSLRAALVTTSASNGQQASSINIGNTTTLLQLSCNEPIISLDMITTSTNSSPTLICIGALGTMVTLSHDKEQAETPKFIVQYPLKLCGGRLTSIACVGCQSSDNTDETRVLFASINDSNQTFLHPVYFKRVNQNGTDDKQSCHRLSIPARIAAISIHSFPGLTGDTTMFTLSTSTGKSIVMKIPLSEVSNTNRTTDDSTTNTSMLSLLNGQSSAAATTRASSYQKNQIKGKSSTLQSLLCKLDLASTTNNKSMLPLSDSIHGQNKHSMKEIREVTQVAASISSPSSKPLTMQCKVKRIEPGRIGIIAEEMPITKQTTASSWITSVHIMQSCPQALSSMLRPQSTKSMTTLCYRRNKIGSPTPVVYGGTSTSHSGNTNVIDVSMNDYIPVSAYASLSMVYTDQMNKDQGQGTSIKTWQQSSNIAQSNLLCSSGSAKPCSSETHLGISLPFDIASKTNKMSPLTLDILDMRGSDHRPSANQGDSDSNNLRSIAEKQVLQWYQQSTSQQLYTLPMIKEQQLIKRQSTGSSAGDAKVYCCSNSLSIGFSGADTTKDCTTNIGLGPLAVIKSRPENTETTSQDGGGEVAFAVGSSLTSPEQALSLLPLIRQAFVRQSLTERLSRSSQRKEDSILETYHLLLTEKKTAKVVKHIIRSCDDLVTKVEKVEHSCPNEVLTAALSLYEIIRAFKY